MLKSAEERIVWQGADNQRNGKIGQLLIKGGEPCALLLIKIIEAESRAHSGAFVGEKEKLFGGVAGGEVGRQGLCCVVGVIHAEEAAEFEVQLGVGQQVGAEKEHALLVAERFEDVVPSDIGHGGCFDLLGQICKKYGTKALGGPPGAVVAELHAALDHAGAAVLGLEHEAACLFLNMVSAREG